MALTDRRQTILQIFNEVRKKLGINQITALDTDNQSKTMVDYLNDVIDEISDYGDWVEMRQELTVTASTSVIDYSVVATGTAFVTKSIHEIAFQGDTAPMRHMTLDDIRRLSRTQGNGRPREFHIIKTDTSGNPVFRVYPQPGVSQNNQTFDVLLYTKPRLYTESDTSEIPPFPSRMIVSGLLAKALLDESRGTPSQDYLIEYQNFRNMMEEAFNRYNGDTGTDTYFRPSFSRIRR